MGGDIDTALLPLEDVLVTQLQPRERANSGQRQCIKVSLIQSTTSPSSASTHVHASWFGQHYEGWARARVESVNRLLPSLRVLCQLAACSVACCR